MPEFLSQLSECLNCKQLSKDFISNSDYYCYEYKFPLEIILFDDDEKFSITQKQEYIIKSVINRLEMYHTTNIEYMFDHDNPILRLSDTYNVPAEYYVSKEKITADMLNY